MKKMLDFGGNLEKCLILEVIWKKMPDFGSNLEENWKKVRLIDLKQKNSNSNYGEKIVFIEIIICIFHLYKVSQVILLRQKPLYLAVK